MKPKIKYLQETCRAFPSQFEGTTEDGRVVYIRYRGGNLRYGIGKTLCDAMEDHNYHLVWDKGEALDGYMHRTEISEKLSEFLDFSNAHWNMRRKRSKKEQRKNKVYCIYPKYEKKVKKSLFNKGSKSYVKIVQSDDYRRVQSNLTKRGRAKSREKLKERMLRYRNRQTTIETNG